MNVVECGCCGAYHRPSFGGDCRDDFERFPDWENLVPTQFRESGGVIFACIFDGRSGHASGCDVTCYAHVGQHSEGNWQHILRTTEYYAPDPHDDTARNLLRELRDIGYNPYFVRRRPRGA